MLRSLHVISLHGVGSPGSDYADQARDRLTVAMRKRGTEVFWRSAHYSPILEEHTRAYQADQAARGMDAYQLTSDIATNTLADALMFRPGGPVAEKVFSLIDYHVVRARAPVTFIGHSLGCRVAIEYLRARPLVRVAGLVTLACNAALWHLGGTWRTPRQVRSGQWVNLVDRDDMLGGFMEGVAPEAIDVEVKVGGWLLGRWGTVHTRYWGSRALWSRTLPALLSC